ncbi:MAG: lipid-A-disaccharide synthase [Candidatus Kapabacteria bacterium]|nr:lipid-A-disaccharide synthase [Candidatus Kapabacteria bacterium]
MENKKNPFSPNAKHFFIVAGEASGDLHAARLMRALKELLPECRFSGIGGANMAREGLESIVPLADISVVGFWEVAKRYPMFKRLLETTSSMLASGGYDAFIPVDYPGFNLRLAAAAKAAHVPVAWYIAPQLWAWGSDRASKLKSLVDTLLVVLPFEPDFFRQFGIDAHFVGHPLMEDPVIAAPPLAVSKRDREIALFPGSRRQEIARNLPTMLESIATMRHISPQYADYRVTLALSPTLPATEYDRLLQETYKRYGFTIERETDGRRLLARARAGMVKTGTSTLEAALCGMPHVMMYRTSALSYLYAKHLVNLSTIALPNILMEKVHGRNNVVPELVQTMATPHSIAQAMMSLLDDTVAQQMTDDFATLRTMLSNGADGSASGNAARIIAEMVA